MQLFRKSDESSLDRLEREANDDFHLLAELGPECFGVEHLIELRDRVQWRMAQFDRWSRLNIYIGASSVVWMFFGAAAAWAAWMLLAKLAFAAMLLSVLGFIAGVWWLKVKFDSRGELEHALYQIEDELRRRAAIRGRSAHL